MAKNPIQHVRADGFGPFETGSLELSPQLNVILGDNATGKSQLLKLMYAATRALAHEDEPTKKNLSSGIADALVGVFRPEQLGRLASRIQGKSRANVRLKYRGIAKELDFSFSSSSRTEVTVSSFPTSLREDTPVFIPSRELLSIYPGLVALFETREVEFDETWRDTAALLGRPALRGPRGETAHELLGPILEEVEGSVVEENGRFYVRLPSASGGTGKIEAHLVSEGYRKLAMIIRLVQNGVLLNKGYLFWDEPEANLNPTTQRALARSIVALARSGTQVFVATHSVFMLRELSMLLDGPDGTEIDRKFIGLRRAEGTAGRGRGAVMAESVDDPADLAAVAAIEAEFEQSRRYLES